ncbi:MAG: energy-coupling factor ABC transporter permease [Nitrospinae bacterium]|nr:energy-coupling factor ABC transporter permease [Nitrospinota bacterium]
MHLPDGFITGEINLLSAAVSAAALGVALKKSGEELGDRQAPMLGVTSAFVFAAQMINFPIAAGTSGHFLGASFAAIMLGPFNALIVMALALTLQCLLFADGGLTTLGTNFLNMGLIGGFGAYCVFIVLKAILPQSKSGMLTASAIASWFSVFASGALCGVELGLSGAAPLHLAVSAMGGTHAIIGVGEAVITSTVLSLALNARPDIVRGFQYATVRREPQP